jgi:hypothetical protein
MTRRIQLDLLEQHVRAIQNQIAVLPLTKLLEVRAAGRVVANADGALEIVRALIREEEEEELTQ